MFNFKLDKMSNTNKQFRRVSIQQLDLLWEFLDSNKDIASAYNRSLQAKNYSKKKWIELSNILNSIRDGVHKDWRGWSKYWVDYKAKLKKRAAAIRASHNQTGGGPSAAQPLSEIETKFLSILGENFGQGLPGIRVDPFAQAITQNVSYGEVDLQDSPVSESILVPPNATLTDMQDQQLPIIIPIESPLDLQLSTNRTHTPSHILTPSPPARAASVEARSSLRRKRRRQEQPISQDTVRRALMRMSRRQLELTLRITEALERIAHNTQNITDMLRRQVQYLRVRFPYDPSDS